MIIAYRKIITFTCVALMLFACREDDLITNFGPIIEDQEFNIVEDASRGTVIGSIYARDQNLDELTFIVKSKENTNTFSITSSGIILLIGTLNYDSLASYSFLVEVTDGQYSATANITINIGQALSEYNKSVVTYFKLIALGYEYGTATEVTRKWNSNMKMFLGGRPTSELIEKVEHVMAEINELATDGFQVEIVNDSLQSNCYIFFGGRSEYLEKFPELEDVIIGNSGLYAVWLDNDFINRASIFIDTEQREYGLQESIILEEITQSLGLGMDSPKYPNSIFYETSTDGGFATEYADIDRELIRLLYHPQMRVGLNRIEVEEVLRKILLQEQNDIQ